MIALLLSKVGTKMTIVIVTTRVMIIVTTRVMIIVTTTIVIIGYRHW